MHNDDLMIVLDPKNLEIVYTVHPHYKRPYSPEHSCGRILKYIDGIIVCENCSEVIKW